MRPRSYALALALIAAFPVARAQPAQDPLPSLIATAKTQTNDPISLSATLAEALRHTNHASDDELKQLAELRQVLAAKLADRKPPVVTPMQPAPMPQSEPASPPTSALQPAPQTASPAPSAKSTQPVHAEDNDRLRSLFAQAQKSEQDGDISAARRLYRVAANDGYAQAARSLAQLYDPGYLAKLHVVGGISPSVVDARRWYERAAALGDQDAPEMLANLPRQEPR